MSAPTERDRRRVNRLGKYLGGKPRVIQEFKWQSSGQELKVFTDSDWAGCTKSRKSTSAGVIMSGSHTLKFWSKTQQTLALSSGEAELMALVKGSCEAIGAQSFMEDLGHRPEEIGIYCDATAAIGMVQRAGIGRTRHIDVGMLWVQQKAWQERLKYGKVLGTLNCADALTKNVPAEVCSEHLRTMGFHSASGRAESAAKFVDTN